jgi:serine protease
VSKAFRINALFAGIALAVAGTAAAGPDGDRVWVKFKPGSQRSVEAALRGAGAQVHHSFHELGAFAVSLPPQALNGLRNNPNIEYIEADPAREPMAQTQPYGIAMVQAPQAWAAGGSGSNVLLCVIDSGINASHEDFSSGQITGGYPGNWASDTCGHGTHVAGSAAAANNSLGVVGVAPNAPLYIVRVFSGGSDGCAWGYSSDVLDAANRCASAGTAQGRKVVINMSLGGSQSSTTEGNGFQALYNTGNVLSIAAAGNAGNTSLSYPASYASVMSVAAIDSNKALASFSQRNAQVEIAAPGVGILSTMPFTDASVTVSNVGYTVAAFTGTFQGSASGALISGGRCTAANSNWSGKVVLCERGDIAFADKMTFVQNSGGRAAIIYNNVAGDFAGTLNGATSTIPTVSMSQADGQFLVANRIGVTAAVSSIKTNPANGYGTMDGTSMASPHVAGAAAAIWSAVPTATNAQIRNAMISTAEDLGAAGRDNSFGWGLVRTRNAIDSLAPAADTTPPSVPGSPSASAASSSQINVTWTASTDTGGSGLAGYKVERCAGSSCTNFAEVATTTSTSHSSTGLAAATSYRFRMRAHDGAGNHSGYSTIVSATTQAAADTTAPTVPGSLTASASSSSAIGLSWSASTDSGGSGLAGYKIERCTGSSCTSFAQIATTTSTSFSNTGLAASTTYRYRVRAHDGAGNNSGYSTIASANTQSAPPPSNVLQKGVAVTGLAGSAGSELRYTMEVAAGASNLTFTMSGGTGDADLYVRFGSAPTTSSYNCRPYLSGNNETCTIAAPSTGTWHVMVRGYTTFSGVSLVGNFTAGSTQPSFFENTADYAIRDNSTVESPISVSGRSGNAPTALKVNVRIIHTYIGDLVVDLIAPNGSVFNLHNRSGGSADNIITTYTVNASGSVANGSWRLRVRDAASGDTGYIDSWSLQF